MPTDTGMKMAVFCDFENVALGAKRAGLDHADIKIVIDRLLVRGDVVVKKAYCDGNSTSLPDARCMKPRLSSSKCRAPVHKTRTARTFAWS